MMKWRGSIYFKTWLAFLALILLLAAGSLLTLNQLGNLATESRHVQQAWEVYNLTSDIQFTLDATLRSLINALAQGDRGEGKKILQHVSRLRERVQRLEALHERATFPSSDRLEERDRLQKVSQGFAQMDSLVYEILRLVIFAERVQSSDLPKQLGTVGEELAHSTMAPSGETQTLSVTQQLTSRLEGLTEEDFKTFRDELQRYFPDLQKLSSELLSLESTVREQKPKELVQKLARLTGDLATQLRTYSVLVKGDLTEAMSRARLAQQRTVLRLIQMGVAILVLAVLLSIILARHLTRPVQKLRRRVEQLSQGQFDPAERIESQDEIGQLARAFDDMARKLKRFYEELDQKVQEKTKELLSTHSRLEKLFNSITDGIAIIDPDSRMVDANDGLVKLTGHPREQLIGQFCFSSCFGRIAKCETCPSETVFRRHRPAEVELTISDQVRGERHFEVTSFPLKEEEGKVVLSLEYIKDITERKALERHVLEREKLASLGVLAAGMAHEIRNPLGIIKSSAGMLKKGQAGETEQKELADFVIAEVDRLNALIGSLLDFAKHKAPCVKEVALAGIVENALKWTEKELESRRVQVDIHLAEHLPPLKVDADQFQQVFLNLILNSLDAMPHGGVISISAQMVGRAIQIRFQDTGSGIPDSVRKHIFEPFYSNKEKGVGLGLSIVYRIVDAHGGTITVESRKGEGTCFTLTLPCVEDSVLSQKSVSHVGGK